MIRATRRNVRQSNSSEPSAQWYSVQSQRWDNGIHVPSPHMNSSLLHFSSGASVGRSVGPTAAQQSAYTVSDRVVHQYFRVRVKSYTKCPNVSSNLISHIWDSSFCDAVTAVKSSSVMWCIVAKRCVLEQKLLLAAYRKSYIRNQLVPKWMTLTFV